MKKLWITFVKDVKLMVNGPYFYLEIGVTISFILIMLFIVPENFNKTQTLYIFIEDKSIQDEIQSTIFETNSFIIEFFESRDAVEKALSQNRSAFGAHVMTNGQNITFDIILQGYESNRTKALIKASIEGEILSTLDLYENHTAVQSIHASTIRMSDRLSILPVYLVMNVAFMGLLIIAAYVFIDKEEGVIRAFAVTPVHIWQYLLSKIMIIGILGLLTSLVICFILVGSHMNYIYLIGLVLSFSFFGSTLGLLLSSFFETFTQSIVAFVFVLILILLASLSYFMPSISPTWMTFLPSYPMIFSFRELFSENANMDYILQNISLFFTLSFIIFIYTNHRFKNTLTV